MLGKLLDHYRVVSKVGEGGMGVVYRAQDEVLHRDVAIKLLSSRVVADKSAKEFLLDEARAASALSHPNICTIHQVGEVRGEPYIVMELIEGKPLSALLGKDGVPVESVLRYGVQIASALAHSHARNIVHRDLKSSNVMVTPDGLVKVLDFGLARKLRLDQTSQTIDTPEAFVGTTVASSGGLTGTLPYMPPEVLRGQDADFRSDIWALGIVLYEAASARLPFRGHTAFEVSSAIFHDLLPPLPAWIPGGLWGIVQKCVAKEPQQRYQRASEVQAALEAVQSASIVGSAVSAVGATPSELKGPLTIVHRGIRHLVVKECDVLLMVGTMKGAFLLRSNVKRGT